MRFIESDENLALRGAALKQAIKDDIKLGLVPFWVSSVFFNNSKFIVVLSELTFYTILCSCMEEIKH